MKFCLSLRSNCDDISIDISILSALTDSHVRGRARPGLNYLLHIYQVMPSDRENFSKIFRLFVALEICRSLRSNCDAILTDISILSTLSDGHVRGRARPGMNYDTFIR